MTDTGTFYLVWNPANPKTPQHRHATETQAMTEAARLAQANPGAEFFVLEACAKATMPAGVSIIPLRVESIVPR